jgi:hypothetical protein
MILNQIHSPPILTSNFCNTSPIFQLTAWQSVSLKKILCALLVTPILVTCPAHRSPLDFSITTLDECINQEVLRYVIVQFSSCLFVFDPNICFLSTIFAMMKFFRAISRVKWLSGEQTNVSKTISVLVLRVLVWKWLSDNGCQTSTLRTRTEMVFETLVCSPLNHLTRLIARENFIILSRRESNKSHYICKLSISLTELDVNPDTNKMGPWYFAYPDACGNRVECVFALILVSLARIPCGQWMIVSTFSHGLL